MFLHQDLEDKRMYEALPNKTVRPLTQEVLAAKKAYESAFSYHFGCKGSERKTAQERLNIAAENYRALWCASLP